MQKFILRARTCHLANKTTFDFVLPFGALAWSSAVPVRKHVQSSSLQQEPSGPFEDTRTSVINPKRKSVDNLLEQIGHAKAPVPSAQPIPFDQHSPDDETPIPELVQSKAASRSLPRNTRRPLPRVVLPNGLSSCSSGCTSIRIPFPGHKSVLLFRACPRAQLCEKESSPGPRKNWKGLPPPHRALSYLPVGRVISACRLQVLRVWTLGKTALMARAVCMLFH